MNTKLFPPEFMRLVDRGTPPPLRVRRNFRSGRNFAVGTGASLEFQEFRSYVPGDDPRDLDWNLFRRSRKLFLRCYRQFPESTHCILLDISNSIRFSTVRSFTVWRTAALLGAQLLKNGDRIRLESAAGTEEPLPPGRESITVWCESLSRLYEHGEDFPLEIPAANGETRWVISDFYAAPNMDELQKRWRHARFIPIRIFEPAEYDPATYHQQTLTDAETGQQIAAAEDSRFDRRYQIAMQQFESFLNTIGIRSGSRLHRMECTESVKAIYQSYMQSLNY